MRRSAVLTAVLVLSAGAAVRAADEVPRETLERDLELVAKLTTPEEIQPGQRVDISLGLRNRSKTATHRVVKPGDGSGFGLREPHVAYRAQVDPGDGKWRDVPPARGYWCKYHDTNWHDEVVEIGPGESLDIRQWLVWPSAALDFQQPGRVRLTVGYAYRAKPVEDKGLGSMEGVEPFEIVAKPLEFRVVRPLEVVVSLKEPLRPEEPRRASEFLDIRAFNRSDAPIEVDPAAWMLELDRDSGFGPLRLNRTVDATRERKKVVLQPGESVPLVGDGPFAGGFDRVITARTEKLRLSFVLRNRDHAGPRIRSNWVEIPVGE